MNWTSKGYSMLCGQAEAVERKYTKHLGKSKSVWLIADQANAGDYVYVTNNPQNTTNPNQDFEGFGGATLKMPLTDGTIFELHGGWHSNSQSCFDDTGIDTRNKHLTFVVLGEKFGEIGLNYETSIENVVYIDKEPTIGTFNRHEELIKLYPNAKVYYKQSTGGAKSGHCNLEGSKK